ncbi:UDP-glucose--hexose-1-phosphate uridylyltransferase [Chitinophaga costaii]|nr:UDP-glucose--hexose-1-phosphate uridylyltransferase [Chitinophaga costaii]
MMAADLLQNVHTRYNLLTAEWVLVSPHRNKRPWQGKVEAAAGLQRPAYMADCYLCPGNHRAEGVENPVYTEPYAFTNDFAALIPGTPEGRFEEDGLLIAHSQQGQCRVICFSPRHDLTLPQMELAAIEKVVQLWKEEYVNLAANPSIRYIQIFENKGEIMGCSNPHPHGQIWAQSEVPTELVKETRQQQAYYEKNHRSLLADYLALEEKKKERIVCENEHFVALVPFWAVWPYETMIISRRQVADIREFTPAEQAALASILKRLTTRYDNLFQTSFPYSAGMHQAPVNDGAYPGWHWHMHFYPPLLRSATVKKFMVGYEMLASPQRDITPEMAAAQLQVMREVHFLEK